jgi:subtilisin family serine protease
MAAVEHSHYVAYVRLRIREMCLFTEAALMRRIAVLAAGLVLVAAAQAPAAAAAGSAVGPARAVGSAWAVAAKPGAKPTSKPSKPSKPPATPSLPVPVATEPGPSQQCGDSNQVTSKVKSVPWAQQALDWSSVWPLTEGRGIKVAVVDSGVDSSPQLAGKVTAIDLTSTGFQDCSGEGHGTAIAGIIAASVQAQGNPFEGVAPEAKILSVKVFTQTQQSNSSATLAQGINDAALLGAQVINVSMTTRNSAVLRAAVEFALSRNVVIVASGGNDDQQNGVGPFYPASYPGVLSVGAVEQDGSLAPFSDQRSRVAVTAPGVGITSTAPGGYSVNSLSGRRAGSLPLPRPDRAGSRSADQTDGRRQYRAWNRRRPGRPLAGGHRDTRARHRADAIADAGAPGRVGGPGPAARPGRTADGAGSRRDHARPDRTGCDRCRRGQGGPTEALALGKRARQD